MSIREKSERRLAVLQRAAESNPGMTLAEYCGRLRALVLLATGVQA